MRKPRPVYVRGIGLTPRLFEALLHANPGPIEALPSAYLPTISRHVECVAPSKQVFAQYWCPVVFEDKGGQRHMLHVDPIVVRTFRRSVAEELQHVREKRKRMLKRIRHIRQDFPQFEARDTAARLQREVEDAQARSEEKLLQTVAEDTSLLHVFLEVTPNMIQLEMVCRLLVEELPATVSSTGLKKLSFSILNSDASSDESLPTLAPFDPSDATAWTAACDWLLALRPPAPPNASRDSNYQRDFRFANALRWVTTSQAFDARSRSAVLLLACSKPVDLDACAGLAQRSGVPLHLVGVFGLSSEDPEPGLQQLADAAAPGSSLRLFFGPLYWSRFIASREAQLEALKETAGESFDGVGATSGDTEIVSAKTFEMRLIERVMRECYSEEQQSEEELTCATRVFERTLIEREDLLAVLRGANVGTPKLPAKSTAPATAR
jgi:hypothetical protein